MGRQLGKYQLLKSIATGGMAEIHVAKQQGVEGFEKLVVVKLLQDETARNPAAVDLFLNEAKLAARLSHPNVVQIFDLGMVDDEYFIAMEYIHGENLIAIAKAYKKQKKLFSMELILSIVCGALEGLNYAHTQTDQRGNPLDIVHCDVSPHNILVSFEGVTKLVDFGIAKVVSKFGKTESKLVTGKLSYMSPEQSQGKPLDARTDLFSLGIVLWELTAGRRLYGRRPAEEILKLLSTEEIPSPRHVNPLFPLELEPIVLKAVSKDPEKRFQSAFEMHTALVGFMKKKGMTQSTMELSAVMKDLFRSKIDSVKRIEAAQATGEGLEGLLFEGLQFDDSMTDPGIPVETDSSAPIEIQERRFTSSLPPTSITGPKPPRRSFPWMGILVVLIVLGLGAAGWFYRTRVLTLVEGWFADEGAQAQTKDRGTLRIESQPDGAKVQINGKSSCKAPCVLADMEVGIEHSFEATMPGYEPESGSITLEKAGDVEELVLSLAKIGKVEFGIVEISTEPSGARIQLDGKPLRGTTPMILKRVVARRRHRLRAILPGRQNWRTTFRVGPKQRITVQGKLPPAVGRGRATLTIESSPQAVVFIDSVERGRTPLKGLVIPAGTHMVDLRNPDTKWTESLIIEASEGEAVSESVTFPTGTLEVESLPHADVFIDGKRIGTTPIKSEVLAGSHRVTLENFPNKLKAMRRVKVKPNKLTRLEVDLRK